MFTVYFLQCSRQFPTSFSFVVHYSNVKICTLRVNSTYWLSKMYNRLQMQKLSISSPLLWCFNSVSLRRMRWYIEETEYRQCPFCHHILRLVVLEEIFLEMVMEYVIVSWIFWNSMTFEKYQNTARNICFRLKQR